MFKKENDLKNSVNLAHQALRSLIKNDPSKITSYQGKLYFLKYKQLPRKKKASSIAVGAQEHLKDHPEKGPQVSTPHAAHTTHTHCSIQTTHCTHQT